MQQPIWDEKAWFLEDHSEDPDDIAVSVSVNPMMPENSCVLSFPGVHSREISLVLRAKLSLGDPKPVVDGERSGFYQETRETE